MKLGHLLCSLMMTTAAIPASASAATMFQVGSSPGMTFRVEAPSASYTDAIAITYQNVSGTYPRSNTPAATISFFFNTAGGGFQIFDPIDNNATFADLSGTQLFRLTGAGAAFASGDYTLFDNLAGRNVSVRITSDPASGVPEPTSWALLVGGFGMIGAVMRRRASTPAPLGA